MDYKFGESSKIALIENRYQQIQSEISSRRILRVLKSHSVEEFLMLNKTDIISLPGMGIGSVDALVDVQNKIKAYINVVMNMSEESTNKNALRDTYQLNDWQIDFYDQHGRLPMFSIAIGQIKGLVSERNWEIATQKFPLMQHSVVKPNKELGEAFNIEEERVRQISVRFKEKFSELTFKSEDWQWYYDALLAGKDYVEVNGDTKMNSILHLEDSPFSDLFAWSILQSVFRDEYLFVGGSYDHIEKNWSRILLMKRCVAECFDFDLLRSDMLERCSVEKKSESCKISSLAYNQRYLRMIPADFGIIKEMIVKVIEDIKGLSIAGDEIRFDESRKATDILYEILQERYNPMKLDELYSELLKRDPKSHYSAPAKIRGIMQSDSRFGVQGKESIFTLSEWTHVYSGNKMDAIADILQKNGGPMELNDIIDEINRLFPLSPTDEKKMEYIYYQINDKVTKIKRNVWGLVGRDDG